MQWRPPLPRAIRWSAPALIPLLPRPAFAHGGHPPTPQHLWSAWTFDPGVVLGLAIAMIGYAIGVRRLWQTAGTARGIARWRTVAFGGGMLTLVVALVSPLDALGSALFSAHMVQHLLLLTVAAPLLVLGDPLQAAVWILPLGARRRVTAAWKRVPGARATVAALTRPIVVWVAAAAVLWFWHLPAAYDWALDHEAVHALEHASFLGVSFVFWWLLFRPAGARLDRGAGILYVFTMGIQGSALGAVLAFARSPWYPGHAPWTAAWGLTPLADQQLAGLIMWIPTGLIYLAVAAVLFVQWLEPGGPARASPLPTPGETGGMHA